VIRPVSSQLAEFHRLPPTPASSDEVSCSAVNRGVASSNLARGAKSSFSFNQLQILLSQLLSSERASVIQVRVFLNESFRGFDCCSRQQMYQLQGIDRSTAVGVIWAALRRRVHA
jgi:hypothetical protein